MTGLERRLAATLTWQEARTGGEAVATALEAARGASEEVVDLLSGADEVILTGAGSSLYLAQALAWTFREATGRAAMAVPLSEYLLRPDGVVTGPAGRRPVVVVSRSGSTSEAVTVARMSIARGHPTIAITCRAGSPLAAAAHAALVSRDGDEEAIVMTRSFTSMLALGLRVVARVAGSERLARDLDALPDRWEETEPAIAVAATLAARSWSRVVSLGGGGARAIASESTLKLTETSRIQADAYEPFEFRHGPISVCEPGVLVIALPGDPGTDAELRVVAEARALGSSIWILGPVPGGFELPFDTVQSAPGTPPGDLTVSSIGVGLHHAARLPLLMPALQAFAVGLALSRNCDPDRPRHLSQVVVRDG